MIMAHQKSYVHIMTHSMQVLPLQIAALNGNWPVLCTYNDPQYASAAFTDCSIEWELTPETSSPHYRQSNILAESCVKIIKHMLQCAKYSGTNQGIALQHLQVTSVDATLPSIPHMLYNCKIHTTIPSRICIADPAALQVQEHLKD